MRWKRVQGQGDMEDRRGQSGGGLGGGGIPIPMGKGAGGIGVILAIVVALLLLLALFMGQASRTASDPSTYQTIAGVLVGAALVVFILRIVRRR